MINFRSVLSAKIFVVIGILLGACYAEPAKNGLKINVHYWTHTGQERCVNLAGVPYCFLNKDIEAASFITDPSAGFLFMVPTDDPDLIECAEDWYKIDWEHRPYPNIQMTVGEPLLSQGDTNAKKYKRVHDNELFIITKENSYMTESHISVPRQYIDYFGEKCLKLNDKDLLRREALCHGGSFEKGEPAYFWGCVAGQYSLEFTADGMKRINNPSCRNQFFFKDLEYSVTASKKCAPFMNNKLRDFALKFVEQGRARAQRLSAKPKKAIK